jgi:hypothetical protein
MGNCLVDAPSRLARVNDDLSQSEQPGVERKPSWAQENDRDCHRAEKSSQHPREEETRVSYRSHINPWHDCAHQSQRRGQRSQKAGQQREPAHHGDPTGGPLRDPSVRRLGQPHTALDEHHDAHCCSQKQ